jgi:hypothetical protein
MPRFSINSAQCVSTLGTKKENIGYNSLLT